MITHLNSWLDTTISSFPVEDEKDFLSRKQRKRAVKGRDVEWFERHRGQGIEAVHEAMSRNQMR